MLWKRNFLPECCLVYYLHALSEYVLTELYMLRAEECMIITREKQMKTRIQRN